MQLSIVTTLYYSAPFLDEFLRRMTLSAERVTPDYELILVNDGSPDDALQKALDAKAHNPRLKIIDLSRNFGHHEAGMVGLAYAQGEVVFLIDCDLEEAPELLHDFWQRLQDQPELDVVYGVQAQRKGGWFERQSGQTFYTLFNAISDIKITPNVLTVRLMKKAFVDSLKLYPERKLFVGGIMAHAGFNQQAIVVKKLSKPTTTYTLARQLQLLSTSVTSFSSKPLEYLFFLGGMVLCSALLSMLVLSVKAMILDVAFTLASVILLAAAMIVGSVMVCTGILGLYIANIQTETKQRPRVIIKRIL